MIRAHRQKTLLVATDSGLQAELLCRHLKDAGYEVIEARSGEEALALAAVARPAAVLTDVSMPRMDGFDLCRAIRVNDTLSATPVVLITELSDSIDVIRALDAGADAIVAKPYDFPTLLSRIQSLTARRVPRDAVAPRDRLQIHILGEAHEVAATGPHIVNLLVSVYEAAVLQKRQLEVAQQALKYLAADTEKRVRERTERTRKRVRELRLLQRASRLLTQRRFDETALDELVKLIPGASEHPEYCKARITFRDITASSPDWRPMQWCQSASFTTSGGTGTIEVAYVGGPEIDGLSPFPIEETDALDSLAELVAAYAERSLAEERTKTLEAQLRHSRKLEALGMLASGIAHDFNNLLTTIGVNVDLALGADPGEPVRESLAEIRKAYARARDLVKRILTFSRGQAIELKPVALASVVEEALALLGGAIPRNVEVRVRCAADLPLVAADASQIHQVIMNLGTNAAHAMEERGGILTIEIDRVPVDEERARSADPMPEQWVRVTVADTGVGMSPEVVERIFDPFFTTKGHGGTGLGLAVVDGIVSEHHGAITVESELGRGTTFRMYFPEAGAGGQVAGRAGGWGTDLRRVPVVRDSSACEKGE